MKILNRIIFTVLAAIIMVSCGDVTPTTWDDVATGIPADGEAFVTISDSVIGSDIYKKFVSNDGDFAAMDEALGLCSTRPDHIAGFMRKSDFVATWPASDPEELAEATKDWKEAELHGGLDGRAKTIDNHSIVVSETQIWVVNSRDGVKVVNSALKAAADHSIASIPALRNLIASKDVTTTAFYRLDEGKDAMRFVSVSPILGERGVAVDVELKNAEGSTEPLIESTTLLDIARLRTATAGRAFAALETPEELIPKVIKAFANLTDEMAIRIAAGAVAKMFDRCTGTLLVAVSSDGKVEVRLPFATSEDAAKARADLSSMLGRMGVRIEMDIDSNDIVFNHTVDFESFDAEVGPIATVPEFGNEPLIGLAECHVSNKDVEADIVATLTANRVRISIEAPSAEEFRNIMNELSK